MAPRIDHPQHNDVQDRSHEHPAKNSPLSHEAAHALSSPNREGGPRRQTKEPGSIDCSAPIAGYDDATRNKYGQEPGRKTQGDVGAMEPHQSGMKQGGDVPTNPHGTSKPPELTNPGKEPGRPGDMSGPSPTQLERQQVEDAKKALDKYGGYGFGLDRSNIDKRLKELGESPKSKEDQSLKNGLDYLHKNFDKMQKFGFVSQAELPENN